jgi:diaminobutyrate-2-oxoglutarate transaminase
MEEQVYHAQGAHLYMGAAAASRTTGATMNARLDERLRDWVARRPDDFAATAGAWSTLLGANGLHFENRPYPVSLRPLVLGPDDVDLLRQACGRLFALLEKVLDLYRDDPAVRHFFTAYAPLMPLLLEYPSYRPLIRVCRFDCAWFGGDDFKILEPNTACPGGVIQNGLATHLWQTSRGAAPLIARLRPLGQPLVDDPYLFVKELVSTARSVGIDKPSAAVVNLKGCYTNEVDRIIAGFSDAGIPAQLCDARELHLYDGRLQAGDRPVTLTYNKLDPLMLQGEPEVTDYLEAIRRQAVCSVNPLVAQLISEDKSILAFLSDPRHAHYFTGEELAVIARHVPWTRLFEDDRTTVPDGTSVNLPRYVAEHRTSLVLKPANLTRGAGVVVGASTIPSTWHTAMEAARSGRYVVQDYVPLPTIGVPHAEAAAIVPMQYGLDCYLFSGQLAGFQSRASADPVVNVGRGGWLLPVLHAEER